MKSFNGKGFSSIALARETESPENPGALEKRVALIPDDAGRLTSAGIEVFVERGAGEGVGFSDDEYRESGARMLAGDAIYASAGLIIKFKGPSLAAIKRMRAGSTLFCMAHFNSYPERAKLLQDRRINVIAMEEISESPKVQSDENILGRLAMAAALEPYIEAGTMDRLNVRFIGWSERMRQAINRCGNRNPASQAVIQPGLSFEELDAVGPDALCFFDGRESDVPRDMLDRLKDAGTAVFDLHEFEKQHCPEAITAWRAAHPPAEFGLRRIQCLHETGRAGARYGLKLLAENKPGLDVTKAKAVVLGYGNVAKGAMDELYRHGVAIIHVLGRTHTASDSIGRWLDGADIVINGAEQPQELRGVNFLITSDHVGGIIPAGSVVIDLVGGSPTNRSPVEPVVSCSFLTDPHFVQDGVTISALWGWPMMGMMRETAIRYSGQITDVLLGPERLIDGLSNLAPGVQRALVCGPFQV